MFEISVRSDPDNDEPPAAAAQHPPLHLLDRGVGIQSRDPLAAPPGRRTRPRGSDVHAREPVGSADRRGDTRQRGRSPADHGDHTTEPMKTPKLLLNGPSAKASTTPPIRATTTTTRTVSEKTAPVTSRNGPSPDLSLSG